MRNRQCTARTALAGLIVALLTGSTLSAAGCMISTQPLVFGRYDVFDPAPTDTTAKVSYVCNLPVTPPVVRLSAGLSSSFAPREMTSLDDALRYNVFLDASCTTVFGDGTAGTTVFSGAPPAEGVTYEVMVFGRIPARQNVHAGTYSDTLVLTIEF